MSNTDIQHSAHKGLWIRISETPSSFKVENMSTDEKEIACYKSKLLLEEPIYFFCGKATDPMKDLLRVNKDLVSQALRLQEHEIDLCDEVDLSEKYPEDRMIFCMPDGLELSLDRRYLKTIERTTSWENLK